MAMAQDVNSDLLREKENNLVEMTRLQGYVWYMQDERQEMNKAWADSIAQLEKEYWMYYQYSPEGMAELTEAQYAATNVTLEQADNGTDAQKEMALQKILDWYFEKYWDIIERSEGQVINDVIRLAKEKWISLNDALNENFVVHLKNKPQFSNYSTWWGAQWKLWQGKDWELFFYNAATNSVIPFSVGWETEYYDTSNRWERRELFKKVVDSNTSIHNIGTTIESVFKTGNVGWSCWKFANDYALAMIGRTIFWDDISEKPVNSQTPTVWSCIVFDWTNSKTATDFQKEHWHVWIVTSVSNDGKKLHIVDSNWGWDWLIKQYDIDVDAYNAQWLIKWYYDFQAESWIPQVSSVPYNSDKEDILAKVHSLSVKDLKNLSNKDYEELVWWLWANSASEAHDMAVSWWHDENLKEVTSLVDAIDYCVKALESENINVKPHSWDTFLWAWDFFDRWKTTFNDKYADFTTNYDYIYNVLWMRKYKEMKQAWATFWNTTEWEWSKVYKTMWALDTSMSSNALANSLKEIKQDLIDTTKWRYVANNNQTYTPDMIVDWTKDEYTPWWSFEWIFGNWN